MSSLCWFTTCPGPPKGWMEVKLGCAWMQKWVCWSFENSQTENQRSFSRHTRKESGLMHNTLKMTHCASTSYVPTSPLRFFSFASLLPPSLAFMPPLPLLRLFLYHYLFRSLYLSAPSLAVILRTPLRLFLLSSVAVFFFYISVCLPHFISSGCWFITGTAVHICVFVHIGEVCTIQKTESAFASTL